MRGTKIKAAETRERIIAEAAQQYRSRGFGGIGVAELMQSVGLTHGGFYAHFASKEELMALACRRAVSDMLADWRAKALAAPEDTLGAIIRPYLSQQHRDDPSTGCLMAALGPEVARQSKHVRQVVTESLEEVIESLASLVRETTPAERRNRAIRIFTTLVGAMVTARAVNDSAVADTILRTVEEALSESLDFIPGARTKLPEHKKRPRS